MSAPAQLKITIVSACMRPDGTPTFVRTEVEVAPDQADEGLHYYFAEADLLQAGFEEPMVHFTEEEAPDFLLANVRECLPAESSVEAAVQSEKP